MSTVLVSTIENELRNDMKHMSKDEIYFMAEQLYFIENAPDFEIDQLIEEMVKIEIENMSK